MKCSSTPNGSLAKASSNFPFWRQRLSKTRAFRITAAIAAILICQGGMVITPSIFGEDVFDGNWHYDPYRKGWFRVTRTLRNGATVGSHEDFSPTDPALQNRTPVVSQPVQQQQAAPTPPPPTPPPHEASPGEQIAPVIKEVVDEFPSIMDRYPPKDEQMPSSPKEGVFANVAPEYVDVSTGNNDSPESLLSENEQNVTEDESTAPAGVIAQARAALMNVKGWITDKFSFNKPKDDINLSDVPSPADDTPATSTEAVEQDMQGIAQTLGTGNLLIDPKTVERVRNALDGPAPSPSN